MDDVRISLPADPGLISLLDSALELLNARGSSLAGRNALVPAALALLGQRTAADAIPSIRRFPPDRRGGRIDFILTPAEAQLVTAMFHHLSLTMPRGVTVIDWDPPHVLTSALVLYSEHVLGGPHLRLV